MATDTKGPSEFTFVGFKAALWGVNIEIDTDKATVKSKCTKTAEPHANGGGSIKKTEHTALDKSCSKDKYANSFEIGGSVMGVIENDDGCTNDGSTDQIVFVHGHISGYGADITVTFGEKKLDLGCAKVACLRGSKRKVYCVQEPTLTSNRSRKGRLGSGDDSWSITSSDKPEDCTAWKKAIDEATTK